jgi:hypothetical protein
MKIAETWGEKIPIGIIYKHEGVPVRETRKNLFRNPVSREEMIRLLTARHANRG